MILHRKMSLIRTNDIDFHGLPPQGSKYLQVQGSK